MASSIHVSVHPFLCISGQTGKKNQFGHASLNCWHFLNFDWLSSFHAFTDKLIMGHPQAPWTFGHVLLNSHISDWSSSFWSICGWIDLKFGGWTHYGTPPGTMNFWSCAAEFPRLWLVQQFLAHLRRDWLQIWWANSLWHFPSLTSLTRTDNELLSTLLNPSSNLPPLWFDTKWGMCIHWCLDQITNSRANTIYPI